MGKEYPREVSRLSVGRFPLACVRTGQVCRIVITNALIKRKNVRENRSESANLMKSPIKFTQVAQSEIAGPFLRST